MIHRVVYLDPDETRCRPHVQPRTMKDHCARFLAPIPATRARVSDYSHVIVQLSDGPACAHYFALSKAVPPVKTAPTKPPMGSTP